MLLRLFQQRCIQIFLILCVFLLACVGGTISNNNGYAYLALSSTTPSYTSTGEITGITEPSGQGYARKLIGHSSEASTLLMTAAANGKVQNAEEIHFDQATEANNGGTGWGKPMTHYAIYTSKTGGSPLLAGELTAPITVGAGYVVIIKKGELVISMNNV